MSSFEVKCDISKYKPLKRINNTPKKDVVVERNKSKELEVVERNFIVDSAGVLSFLLPALEVMNDVYNITYDKMLILLYLKELWQFKLQINAMNRTIRLGRYLSSGYIVIAMNTDDTKLYKLSDKSHKIINHFIKLLSDNSFFINENRETDIDIKRKSISVIEKLMDM